MTYPGGDERKVDTHPTTTTPRWPNWRRLPENLNYLTMTEQINRWQSPSAEIRECRHKDPSGSNMLSDDEKRFPAAAATHCHKAATTRTRVTAASLLLTMLADGRFRILKPRDTGNVLLAAWWSIGEPKRPWLSSLLTASPILPQDPERCDLSTRSVVDRRSRRYDDIAPSHPLRYLTHTSLHVHTFSCD